MNAALAGGAEDLAEKAVVEIRRVGGAKTRRKVVPLGGSEGRGDSGIAGEDNAGGRAGIHLRLLSEDKCLKLVVLFVPGRKNIPAHAVVQHEVGTHLPAILSEGSNVFVANVERTGISLLVGAGDSQQEIREVGAGLRTLENE